MKRTKLFKIIKINVGVIVISGLSLMLINQSCISARYKSGDTKMQKIENSSHYHDGNFKNSGEWHYSPLEFTSTMWDFLFKKDHRTPETELPRQQADLKYFKCNDKDKLNVTWLGHSSLMINLDGYKILTDPVFESKVSFFGPRRYNGDVPLETNDLPNIDIIIISHNHYDHLNKFSIQLLKDKTSKFIVPLAVGAQLEDWGVPRSKIVEMDWWENLKINSNLEITATPAQHFSGRGLTDRNKTLWASFVIKGPIHKIFYSGDSGYFSGFKQIGEIYGPFDMTFIETGAYNEKWHFIHMFPEETVQAHLDLNGKVLHPIHWGTFNLSLHSWFEPMQRLTEKADMLNVVTATPVVGETTIFEEYIPNTKWWDEVLMAEEEQL